MGPLRRAARVFAIGLAAISASAWPAAAPAPAAPGHSADARSALSDERREDSGTAYERAIAQELAYSSYREPPPVAREVVPSPPPSSGGKPSYAAVVVALGTLLVLAGLRLRPVAEAVYHTLTAAHGSGSHQWRSR